MARDAWAPIREARLAREAAEREAAEAAAAAHAADVALVAEALASFPELTQTPGLPGEQGLPGLQGIQGLQGDPGAPAPKMLRAEFERDWVQVTGPVSGEQFWAEVIVGATLYFDDGSTEHSTVIRDDKGRPESVVTDAPA